MAGHPRAADKVRCCADALIGNLPFRPLLGMLCPASRRLLRALLRPGAAQHERPLGGGAFLTKRRHTADSSAARVTHHALGATPAACIRPPRASPVAVGSSGTSAAASSSAPCDCGLQRAALPAPGPLRSDSRMLMPAKRVEAIAPGGAAARTWSGGLRRGHRAREVRPQPLLSTPLRPLKLPLPLRHCAPTPRLHGNANYFLRLLRLPTTPRFAELRALTAGESPARQLLRFFRS